MGILLGKYFIADKEEGSFLKPKILSFGSKRAEKVTAVGNIKADIETGLTSSNTSLYGVLESSSSSHQNDSVSTICTLQWNFEDEYKFYLQKSMKRKQSDVGPPSRKLRKTHHTDLLYYSITCGIPIDKSKNSTAISQKVTRSRTGMTSSNLQLMEAQLTSELRVNLDQTIVEKYLHAKRIIEEILRS